MHVTLYLIFDLYEERIAGRKITRGAAMKVAENAMYNMVENHEDFDYYTVEDAEQYNDATFEKLTEKIDKHIGDVIKRIGVVRKYFEQFNDTELAILVDDGDFKYNLRRIGDTAGITVDVYYIDANDMYEGITTHTELENVLEGMNNAWVATVDAHW
jgi:hypothetical protein